MMTLFPVICGGCNEALPMRPQYLLCELCLQALLKNPSSQSSSLESGGIFYAPYVYGGTLETMIWRTKFRGREDLALALGQLLANDEPAQALAARCELVMPIPLSLRSHIRRGYNQSDHIARRLAQTSGLPLHTNWRRRHTQPQHRLNRQARQSNIRGAFRPVKGVENKTVLIVDDVMTTGFTLREAARTLLQSGAREVHAIALSQANWSYLKT
jgi:ComF family protein